MHELSIAQNIAEAVNEQLKDIQFSKVISIKLKIGELAAIDPNSLKFSFDVITKDTPLECVNLEIDLIPVKVLCHSCNMESIIVDFFFVCSDCGSSDITVLQGDEMNLSEIDYE